MTKKTSGAHGYASGALYLLAAVLLWPTLTYGVLALDDASLLREFSHAPFSRVWSADHFGHLRPVKNLLFWWLSRDIDQVVAVRVALLAAALLSGAMLQRAATQLLGSRGWGLLAVACWLLNPTTASTLAWLATANYVLALLFVLGYVQLARRAPHESPWADGLAFALAQTCLLLAALSHELCLLVPLLLLGAHTQGDARVSGKRRAATLFGALVPMALVAALHGQGRSVALAYRAANHPKALLALSSARYGFANLRLWFWQPGSFGVLLTDAPAETIGLSVICWLGWLALAVLSVWSWRRDPASRFSLLWIGIFLLPVINLVPFGNTPVAMHYLYLPGAGLALLLCHNAQRLSEWLRAHAWPRGRALPAVFVVALVAAWLPEYRSSVQAWAAAPALYLRTLANHPANVEARANLAAAYLERDQLQEADALLLQSLRIAPGDPALIANRFELLWRTERWAEALSFLDAHETLRGSEYRYRRGKLLESLGRWPEALPIYAALSEQASEPELRFLAGYQCATILVNAGRTTEARQIIARMLKEFPGDARLELTLRAMSGDD